MCLRTSLVIRKQTMTPAERRAIKAGKHERIRKLLNNLRATPPATMVKEQPTPAEVLDVTGSDRRSIGSGLSRQAVLWQTLVHW